MIIENSAFTLFFPANNAVRERIFDLEKYFDGFQKPFTLLSVPTDAPPEFPRIISATNNGHSQLAICENNVRLSTGYDGEYARDISISLDYTTKKVQQIIDAMPLIENVPEGNQKFYYSGLTMDFLYGKEDGIDNPVAFINEHHLKDIISLPIDEMQYRLALVLENRYYVNFIMQNRKVFIGHPDERGSFAGLQKADDQLQMSLDINDRYAFNNIAGYTSSKENIIRVSTIMKDFVINYIPSFIRTGELKYVSE